MRPSPTCRARRPAFADARLAASTSTATGVRDGSATAAAAFFRAAAAEAAAAVVVVVAAVAAAASIIGTRTLSTPTVSVFPYCVYVTRYEGGVVKIVGSPYVEPSPGPASSTASTVAGYLRAPIAPLVSPGGSG